MSVDADQRFHGIGKSAYRVWERHLSDMILQQFNGQGLIVNHSGI